jgi:putative SOS response-associated peptidase YedK
MCGRYAARRPPEEVAEWFGAVATGPQQDPPVEASQDPPLPESSIAPTMTVQIVVADNAGQRRLLPAQWGLVPSWARDRTIASSTFNARAETAAQRPAFRDALERRRCLLPAEAFFEWTGPKGDRRPWLIRPAADPFLAFGGLYEHWHDPDGTVLHSCTILTTSAAADIAALHDRAPLLVPSHAWNRWLDPGGGADTITDLLEPAPAGSLLASPIERPPAPAPPQVQPVLF